MLIEEAIRQTLGEDDDVSDLVDDRIYPGEIPDDDSPSPWVLFLVEEELPDDNIEGCDDWHTATIVIECYAETYAAVGNLKRAVRAALNKQLAGDVYLCLWRRTTYRSVEDGHNATVEISIHRTEHGVVEASGLFLTSGGSFIFVE